MSLQFTQLMSSTLQNYRPQLADNVTRNVPLFARLKEKNNIKLDGGRSIVTPLEYAFNDTIMSFYGSETLDTAQNDIITAAEFSWSSYNGAVSWTDDEVAENSGKSKSINLVETKIKNLEKSLMNRLSMDIFSDGTGNGGKNILGLAAIVASSPTTGTLGGIDRDSHEWWRNSTQASLGAWGSTTDKYGRKTVNKLFTTLTRNADKPDLLILSARDYLNLKNEFELAELLQAQTNSKVRDYGVDSFRVNGMDVIFDVNCTDGTAYMLNTDYLKLYINENMNFKMIPPMRPTNAAIEVAHLRTKMQLVPTNCKLQGAITGITAA